MIGKHASQRQAYRHQQHNQDYSKRERDTELSLAGFKGAAVSTASWQASMRRSI
jgi:hypothetical protein